MSAPRAVCGLASHAVANWPRPTSFKYDVDYAADVVKVLPGQDADDPGQTEGKAEGDPEPVLRSCTVKTVYEDGHQQAGGDASWYADNGPPEQMLESAQKDGVMEELFEVLEADPDGGGDAVPGGEGSFQRPHRGPVAEGADKNERG